MPSSPAAEAEAGSDARPRQARTFVADLAAHVGERVVVNGWIERVRPGKRIVQVRDRTGVVQGVVRAEDGTFALVPEDLDGLEALTPESAVRTTGTVRPSRGDGAVQLEVERIELLSPAAAPLPLARDASPEARLDHRYLDLRSRSRFLVFEVQATLERAMREFCAAEGFIEIHSPKISGGGSESGATTFSVPYFGAEAALVQSPQFYMQMAMAAGFDRVLEVGPVFRNEAGVTPRHATEFTIAHFELSWIETHEDLMRFEQELLRFALAAVGEAHGEEIAAVFGVPVEEVPASIPRVSLRDAPDLTGGSLTGESGAHLLGKAEQALSKHAQREHGTSFVFLTDYPADARPFYTMREGTMSRSFDLLWRGIELTSGGQREHRYDVLRSQVTDAGMAPEAVASYLEPYFLEMFRHGCPPHGGFGIGINRLLMALLGLPSIREASYVFRGPGRFVP
ncbi:MAG TPA: aspartate--tRNA(Asn) ligase [Polyangiales bacterium]|nr:aspartate--tRNA(Asn) ligase [Polyangiales bacterium]